MFDGGVLLSLSAVGPSVIPQRAWLDRLAFIVPGPTASRWLLLADAACLVMLGARTRLPVVAIPVALGGGFILLNVLGMAVTDFYLGLAAFHLAVGVVTVLIGRQLRWLGAAVIALALVAGLLT